VLFVSGGGGDVGGVGRETDLETSFFFYTYENCSFFLTIFYIYTYSLTYILAHVWEKCLFNIFFSFVYSRHRVFLYMRR